MNHETVGYRSPSYYELANSQAGNWRDFRSPAYTEYRREWEARPAERRPTEFPLHVDLDPTNACNLGCVICPRTHYLKTGNRNWAPDGRIGFMSWDVFSSVIDQTVAGGAWSVKLNFLGEPLLHPRVVEQVGYAKHRGLEVMMNTNATLLTPELGVRLLEAGLDDIFFSVDSPYPAEYEAIRRGASFDQVVRHIAAFIATQNRLNLPHVQTRVSMVIDPGQPGGRGRREDFQKLFRGLGVAEIGFGLRTEMETDYWAEHGQVPGFVCRDPYQRTFVYWDGVIGPCCGDWERRLVMGRVPEDRLADVWQGPKYAALRQAHESGRYETIPACRACSVPYLSRVEVDS